LGWFGYFLAVKFAAWFLRVTAAAASGLKVAADFPGDSIETTKRFYCAPEVAPALWRVDDDGAGDLGCADEAYYFSRIDDGRGAGRSRGELAVAGGL
jgi:hypothetical protein